MCWDESAGPELADLVSPHDFIDPAQRTLFCFIATMVTNGKAVDIVSLMSAARKRLGGENGIADLLDRIATANILTPTCNIGLPELAEAFSSWSYGERFREIIAGCQKALDQKKPIDKVEQRLEQRLTALQSSVSPDRVFDDSDGQTKEVIEYLSKPDDTGMMTWGFKKMDRVMVPPHSGNLILIGGPSGAGKSTVARNFYANWAAAGIRTAVFSLEMSAKECRINLASMDSGVDVGRVWARNLSDEEGRRFGQALGYWKAAPLIINDRGHLTPDSTLRAMARYHARGAKVFVVDHLHRLDYGEKSGDDLRIPMGNFARDLKTFAMQHECLVVGLVQLKKMARHEEPDESSIRETAKLAEEADGILYVYRPQVACDPGPDGEAIPINDINGRRIFAGNAGKGQFLGFDTENVYIKTGKWRIRPIDALFQIPFNAATGKMLD